MLYYYAASHSVNIYLTFVHYCQYKEYPVKIALFILLLLLYPLFLRAVKITDLRAVPLVIPYLLACLAIVILLSEAARWILKKK